jgi:hypothetical protein
MNVRPHAASRNMGFGIPLGGWMHGAAMQRTPRTGGNEHESYLWALRMFCSLYSQQELNR